jgi:hypothetical protein
LTAAIATFALNAAECVRRVLFVIFKVPLSALSPAQAPSVPLIRLSEFARPRLTIWTMHAFHLALTDDISSTFTPSLRMAATSGISTAC